MSPARRILMVSKMPPHPPNIGGNQRANMIHRALSRHGHVDLMLVQAPDALPPQHLEVLRERFSLVGCVAPTSRGAMGAWRLLRPLGVSRADRLAHHLGRRRAEFEKDPVVAAEFEKLDSAKAYDLVVGLELRIAFKTGFSTRRPHIIDLIDLDTDYYRSRLAAGGRGPLQRVILRRHLRQLEQIIPDLLRNSRHIWVANPTDLQHPGLQHAKVLPNIPYVGPGRERIEALPPSAQPVILFVGSFYHDPNVEGVSRFLSGLWAKVIRDEPQAELHIYGVGIDEALRRRYLAHPGVKLLDPSSDLKDAYARCAFAVAPIYWGAGTCFKVVEALAFGRTVALTPYAARGYDDIVRDGDTALVGRSDDELVRACVRLLKDPDLRNRLAAEAARRVAQSLSIERFQSVVDDTVGQALAGAGGGS